VSSDPDYKQDFPKPKMMNTDMCKFCYSNGEAESQYRSHQLKTNSGLVTCPVLRSFICPICKATGDFAHTQRYCPRNKDGQFNSGASLTDLKRRKNAAGNFPSTKKMAWPIPSSMLRNSYTGNTKIEYAPRLTDPKDIVERSSPFPLTDPLPSSCRPSSHVILASQPQCAQLTMYRHQQYIKYYHEQQMKHEKELVRLESMRHQKKTSPPAVPCCYARIFPSQNPVTTSKSSGERFRFPDVVGCTIPNEEFESGNHINASTIESSEGIDIGSMLAELRVGTMEVDV